MCLATFHRSSGYAKIIRLRPIRARWYDRVLKELRQSSPRCIPKWACPSIPAGAVAAGSAACRSLYYGACSERLLVEEIDYNVLSRWFVGLSLDDEVWDATVFSKNRDRLLEAEVANGVSGAGGGASPRAGLASDEHFTVDGSLLEAWAGVKSFQRKNQKGSHPPEDPGNPTVDYRGEKRSNETHESKSDPEAQLARKGAGKEAKLSWQRESAGGESQRVDR